MFGNGKAQKQTSFEISLDFGALLLLLVTFFFKARSPSGKAEDCKSSIVGSIPTRASNFLKALNYFSWELFLWLGISVLQLPVSAELDLIACISRLLMIERG